MRGVRHGRGQQFGVSGLRFIIDEHAVCCSAGNSIIGGAIATQSVWFGNLGSGPEFWDVDLEQVVEVDNFLGFFAEGSESEHVPGFFTEVMEDCIEFVSINFGVFEWKDTLQGEVLVRLGPHLKIDVIVMFPGWQQGTFFVVEVKQSTDIVTSSGSNNVQDVLLWVTEIILSDVVP